MSEVKRYISTYTLPSAGDWTTSCASYTYILAADHDAKVAALEAEIGHLKHRLEAADEWATIASEQLRGRDALAAELAALKGAAGEVPEVVAWKTPSGNLYADKAVAEAGWRGHIRKATPLMTVAQHQRIAAAMARDAERYQHIRGDVFRAGYMADDDGELTGTDLDAAVDHAISDAAFDEALDAHRAGKEGKV